MSELCLACAAVLESVRAYRFNTTRGPGVFGDAHVHRCGSCGLAQVAPRPSGAELAAYYEADYRQCSRNGGDVADAERFPRDNLFYLNRGRSITDLVAPHLATGSPRVLEIGAGFGHNLHALGERFPRAIRSAIEFSRPCVEHLRTLGVHVFSEPAEEVLPGLDERFDLVVLSHVLEHLLDPSLVLRVVRRKLAPGGLVYVEVPNIPEGSLRLYPDHVWNPRYDEPHITFFSHRTLRAQLRAAGFTVVFCDSAGPRYRYVSGLRFRLPPLRWWVQDRVPPRVFHWLRRQTFTKGLRMRERDESFYRYGGDRIWLRSVSSL